MMARVAMITTAAPRKTAAAALIRDQPRLRRASTNGANVAATMAATSTEAVTVERMRQDPDEDHDEGDRREEPPADGGQPLQPAGDEAVVRRQGRRDLAHMLGVSSDGRVRDAAR